MRKKRGKKKKKSKVKSQNKKNLLLFLLLERERGRPIPPVRTCAEIFRFSVFRCRATHTAWCVPKMPWLLLFVCVCVCVFLSFFLLLSVCVRKAGGVFFFFEEQIGDSPGNNRSTDNARNKIINKGKESTLMCGGWYNCAKKTKRRRERSKSHTRKTTVLYR